MEGTDQTVTVSTDPAGATCNLSRNEKPIGVVNPTPGSINLDKSTADVTVRCTKKDFEEETAILSSQFQGMTVGNAIFGGLVGLAIDAGSGAMNEYPSSVELMLTPTFFESIAARDDFYKRLLARIDTQNQEAIAKIRKKCEGELTDQCSGPIAEAEKEHAARIAALEEKRQRAVIKAAN